MNDTEGKRIKSLKEAAKLLQELGICKAFREENKINGPNCWRKLVEKTRQNRSL